MLLLFFYQKKNDKINWCIHLFFGCAVASFVSQTFGEQFKYNDADGQDNGNNHTCRTNSTTSKGNDQPLCWSTFVTTAEFAFKWQQQFHYTVDHINNYSIG